MLEETLIVWATEFGRTPFEEANREVKLGRGHHHKGFTLWMAGGGVKGGLSLGATDEFGMHAVENAVHVHDVHATILHLLGLDLSLSQCSRVLENLGLQFLGACNFKWHVL